MGRVESSGDVKINGKSVLGNGLLWGGEALQASPGAGAYVRLPTLGEVRLSSSAIVRLSARPGASAHSPERKALMVSLMAGDLLIKLEPSTVAYLEFSGNFYRATPGTMMRFSIREDRAVLEPLTGKVVNLGHWAVSLPATVALSARRAIHLQQQAAQRRYLIRWTEGVADVRARSTLQLQVRVTDENDRPVPDLIIILGVGGGIGAFGSPTVTTGANGIANVSFMAGNQTTSGSLTATVQGTQFTASMPVYVLKAIPGFWTWANAGPVFATAAAAVSIGTVKVVTKEDKRFKVKPAGDPVIKP